MNKEWNLEDGGITQSFRLRRILNTLLNINRFNHIERFADPDQESSLAINSVSSLLRGGNSRP